MNHPAILERRPDSRLIPAAAGRCYARSVRRALTTSLVFLAIVLGWVAPRVLTYVCAMDGLARSECCCAPQVDEASAAPHAAFERVGCCEVRSERGVVAMSVVPDPERVSIASPVVLDAESSSWAIGAPRLDVLTASPRGPPRGLGPPLYLRCRVLLI